MHPYVRLTPLAASLAFSMISAVNAAQPVHLQKSSLQNLKQQFQLVVPGLQKSASVSSNSLKFIKEHTDKKNISHVRMQQQYAGFDVIGGYAILHSTKPVQSLLAADTKTNMNGVVYEGLQTELGQPSADFVKKASVALEQFKAQYQGKELSEEQVTPVVYLDAKHNAHWAYKVSVYIKHTDRIPERATAIVDAQTFKPFVKWDDIKTIVKKVKGYGFGGNTKVGIVTYGVDLPLLDITRNKLLNRCLMENKEVKIVDMEHRRTSLNKAMRFDCDENDSDEAVYMTGKSADGYDRENGAFSPSNDALYVGYVIKHMYHDWYGVEALTKRDGSPMQLVMRVHYGDSYENAFWDGRQMTFGDGEDMMYPLVSLGVGGHEVSHGFTEQHSGLEYYGQSGGMNESFSDMAAEAAEYYSIGKNNWMIGAEIMKEDSGYEALRYMDVPSKDGASIDTADDYYDGLDVHYSSGVYNRLFYLMSTFEGWNPRMAFDVMVKANMDYWTPYEEYNSGACGVLSAANDLGYSLDDVKQSLEKVAIDFESCE